MFVIPSVGEIIEVAARFGAHLDEEEARACQVNLLEKLQGLDDFLQSSLPEEQPPLLCPQRSPGHRPSTEEDPYRAWRWRCSIGSDSKGLLAGKTVSFKDHIAVAHIPCSFGMRALDQLIPDFDTTVVTKTLAEGATVIGKNAMNGLFGLKGSTEETDDTDFPQARNPHNPAHLTGGSSTGSGAAVAASEVDISFGGDQGGSIRVPAAYCGVLGLKPTFGLVSHMGITFGADQSIDHVGPLARYVEDIALALEAVAGRDRYDPRQVIGIPERMDARSTLGDGVKGLRVGILQEGFSEPIDPAVRDGVLSAVHHLEKLGATTAEVSIPEHRHVTSAMGALSVEGGAAAAATSAFGMWAKTYYPAALGSAIQQLPSENPHSVHASNLFRLILAEFSRKNFEGACYAKAQNVRPYYVSAYDSALSSFDVLAMPTVSDLAPQRDSERGEHRSNYGKGLRSAGLLGGATATRNTSPFDYTGHPALAVPCGKSAGLPYSMQLVGRHLDDALLLRVAHAYQHSVDWEAQLALDR